jgi:hypothetical protein
MLNRRSFLGTAALALPGAALGTTAAGSSVSPFGRMSTSRGGPPRTCMSGYKWDADGCVRVYPQPGQQAFDVVRWNAEVMFNEYLGFKAPAASIELVGNIYDGLARIANGQERDELTAAATWVGLGSAAGQAIGHFTRFGGSLGAAVGFGSGVAGYAIGATVVLVQNFVATTGAYNTNFNLDGGASFLNAWGASGVGPFGICFPEYGAMGGGGSPCYMIRMY